MRLLNVNTLRLESYNAKEIPPYAILSHVWQTDEVLFEDVYNSSPRTWEKKGGYRKVKNSCERARFYGYGYIWIDTCCIDKSSSAELSEAINSMFLWYQKAAVCFAFLYDVTSADDIQSSRWFTRGWTLQELVAPRNVLFFNKDWSFLNGRFSMATKLASITGINERVLRYGHEPEPANWEDHKPNIKFSEHICTCGARTYDMHTDILRTFSTATILSWAANRHTTRKEDQAYSLMGLFDINMPLLYGEGDRAFIRLQEEIIRRTNDQSILAWWPPFGDYWDWSHPMDLASDISLFHPHDIKKPWVATHPSFVNPAQPRINMAKEGVEVDVLLCQFQEHSGTAGAYLAILDCTIGDQPFCKPAITLAQPTQSSTIYQRIVSDGVLQVKPGSTLTKGIVSVLGGDNWSSPDQYETSENNTWAVEIDLTNAETKKITIARASVNKLSYAWRQSTYLLPPLHVEIIHDCDPGHYKVEHATENFGDKVKVPLPMKKAYGMVSLSKEDMGEFFILWHFRDHWGPVKHEWCNIRPFTQELKEKLKNGYFELKPVGIGLEDISTLNIGDKRRKVTARIKSGNLLGSSVMRLEVSIEEVTESTARVHLD
ncbi:heterokaryon incompatibility protein-domain-containing protein [Xylariaceae sp. FL1651]|nr:heterokaryon incompatibility protein-domain-containing protein [Xylariaceae sp. FL1651]